MSNVIDKLTGRLLAEGKESIIIPWQGKKVCEVEGEQREGWRERGEGG